jgi:hypothetical protein
LRQAARDAAKHLRQRERWQRYPFGVTNAAFFVSHFFLVICVRGKRRIELQRLLMACALDCQTLELRNNCVECARSSQPGRAIGDEFSVARAGQRHDCKRAPWSRFRHKCPKDNGFKPFERMSTATGRVSLGNRNTKELKL